MFNVGTLALASAVAGARAERLPLIVIAGTMNSKDVANSPRNIHHSIGEFSSETSLNAMADIVVCSCRIDNPKGANIKIDEAIYAAIKKRAPVYIEVCCDLVNAEIPSPKNLGLDTPETSPESLDIATNMVLKAWSDASKPVILVGPNIGHIQKSMARLRKLSSFLQVPVVFEPNARYLAAMEDNENEDMRFEMPFIGVYWGALSVPSYIEQIMQSSDLVVGIGVYPSDYGLRHSSTVSVEKKMISIEDSSDLASSHIKFPDGAVYHHVSTLDFLDAFADKASTCEHTPIQKPELLKQFQTMAKDDSNWFENGKIRHPEWLRKRYNQLLNCPNTDKNEFISRKSVGGANGYKEWCDVAKPSDQKIDEPMLAAHIQAILSCNTALVLECGSAWFLSRKLYIPEGCDLQVQMQYGSIGWAAGAITGYAEATKSKNRVLAVVGDGALQMTIQALSMIRDQKQNPIIILLNNSTYAIEDAIHPGPYNKLQSWNYCELASGFFGHDHSKTGWWTTCKTEKDLSDAISCALSEDTKAAFINVKIDPREDIPDMNAFGELVSKFNIR